MEIDSSGRPFYVDNVKKETHWNLPSLDANPPPVYQEQPSQQQYNPQSGPPQQGGERFVPPGMAPGGHWEKENYCGPISIVIGFCVCWCIVCCPVDERDVYVAPDGQRHPPKAQW